MTPRTARRALAALVLLLSANQCGSNATPSPVHHPTVEEHREAARIVRDETREEMTRFESADELVEGTVRGDSITELRRTHMYRDRS